MIGPVRFIVKLLSRWSRQQESALWQMTRRKSFGDRLGGINKNNRMEAKYMALALAPFAPLMLSDELGWPRGIAWYGWACVTVGWAVVVVGWGFAAYWRHFRQYWKRKP